MKKYLIILATAAIAVSCSNNDSFKEINAPNDAIGFSTITGKQTRAENSTATELDPLETYNTTFKVWGSKYFPDDYKSPADEDDLLDEERVFGINDQGEIVSNDGSKWTYSPIRFWDKSATSYSFYAASPSGKSWVWNNSTKKLSLSDFTISGYNSVTGTPATEVDVDKVLTENLDTEDLMISTDVTGYNTYTSATVNLHFNHILSRLNIGVRKATVLDAFDVKLNSIKVFNMTSNGSFDENTTLNNGGENGAAQDVNNDSEINAADEAYLLANGTIRRWSTASTPAKFESGIGYEPTSPLLITSTATTADTYYQYVYEGLVIPQAVAYNQTVEVPTYTAATTEQQATMFKLDGSNATTSSNPYIVIDYEIWTKAVDATTYTAEDAEVIAGTKQVGDEKTPAIAAAKMDGYKYYYNLADVFNGDATTAVNFCEGWQNTLKITLAPVAIEFDADVYEWTTKVEQEVYITEEPNP